MRRLWKELGGYDALVEYNECALRQFVQKWEQFKRSGNEYSEFIKEQASEVNIKLGYIDIEQYQQEIYRWYLIHPYGCVEKFVKEFKDDLKPFMIDINLDFEDRTPLERLICGLKDAGVVVTIENFKLELDKYYHRLRNILAHRLDKHEEEKLVRVFNKIPKDKVVEFYPTLTKALSDPLILTFDDYVLCTANLKNITDTLTTDSYLKIDWNKYSVEGLTHKRKDINRFQNNDKRLSSYIRQSISSHYGLIVDDRVINILKGKLIHSNNG